MPKRTLVYGTAILVMANLFNRLLGFIYQYLIMAHIGSEAYGLFAMVFPIYMMAVVLTTAGIPMAVSKLVSEEVSRGNHRQAKAILKLALGILSASGALVTVALYLIVVCIGERFFPDPRAVPVFLICTLAIFIVSVASAFRGYFLGIQNMLPPALSQVLEQIVRVSCGFGAALYLLPRGITWAAVGLAVGMLIGEAVGLGVIMLNYFFANHPHAGTTCEKTELTGHTLKRIWQFALPVTAGRLLFTGQSAVDALLIPNRLQTAGCTARQATTLFGQLGGAGLTLLNFPSVFTFALAASLVPAIAEAAANNSSQIAKYRSLGAIRVTITLGLPFVVILFSLAEPLTVFFKSDNIAPVLRILAVGGIFSYLQQTTTAILQGLGKAHLPMFHAIAAASVRIPLLYWLTGLPQWGLLGSAWAFVVGYIIFAILNITAIVRYTGMSVDLNRLVVQPLSASGAMLLVLLLLTPVKGVYLTKYLEGLAVGLIIYFIVLFINRGITIKDLRRFIH
ncbi:MAG: putative polysaccharide biosynthesis protein [Methylocystaceae bacterium]